MEIIELKDLGKFLKRGRQEKKLSRQDIAIFIKKSAASIEGYEQGIREPTFQSIDELATLFGYKIRLLIEPINEQKS